ncbi:hypothetical protein L596_005346 [Steinernema carpocapsae]|uniref:Protein kinase domain-containing protein n=1 Tax=Steinernema carpocapsae TaxID=34508 RepID=A0A4U8V065_STECR|nr:hypothetical protein L596_005346 [Steinernema carpocapsae]
MSGHPGQSTAPSPCANAPPPNLYQHLRRPFTISTRNTVEFHIPHGYKNDEYLGAGQYGNCIKAVAENGVEVAIKKMYSPFKNINIARRIYRELKLLQLIDHENILRIIDIYTPDPSYSAFENIYMITEYAGMSLDTILKRQRQNLCVLVPGHITFFIYQLLRALKFLHSANVIHRDLKPSNLAVQDRGDLTVLDFGMSRVISPDDKDKSEYVITRWYRSPEVIYWSQKTYNTKADVWSVGCIFAELLQGKPLFPGEAAMEQYRLIIDLCGSPDEELMRKIETDGSQAMRRVVEFMGVKPRQDFKKHSPLAADLLDKMLVLDADRRITVEEALKHEYLKDYHEPDDEPIAASPFEFDDHANATIDDWKRILWQEIANFKPRETAPPEEEPEHA